MAGQKFLVVSYDGDEQQIFYDRVIAEDCRTAMGFIGEIREYAVPIDALTPRDLRQMCDELAVKTPQEITAEMEELSEGNES
jgi:hypothetical protein